MKVVIIHDFLYQYGGAERVLEVFLEIFPQAQVFTLGYDSSVFPNYWSGYDITSLAGSLPGIRNYPQLYAPYLVSRMAAIDLSEFDLVISSDSLFAKMVLCPVEVKHLCYQYSPADMLYHFLPRRKKRNGLEILLTGMQKSYLRRQDFLSAQLPDRYITLSHYVADRIQKYYGVRAEVIYPPVELPPVSEIYPAGEYYLLVSRLVPNKNIDLAVRCFTEYRLPLVVVGKGDELAFLRSIAGDTINFVTDADDDKRNNLYKHCKALVICNEEDFGITPVESMSYGHGVIAYKKGGVLETVVDGVTGVFFDTLSTESLLTAVKRYESLLLNAEVCRRQSEKFSRTQFISCIKTVIDELAV